MKARITDADALRAITPDALRAFARHEGWVRLEPYGPHADVYVRGQGGAEIIIPRTVQLGDYANVVARLIEEFSAVTERDEMVTYRDLVGADRDVIRVRAFGAEDDGAVQIDAGVGIVSGARDMLLAAACATHNPQPYYRAGANRDAIEYMRRVKMGQTEHGSFIVTLFTPAIPPQVQSPQLFNDKDWASIDDEPADRMVTRRLVEALEASREATELARIGEGGAFEDRVRAGVSANLCEAVAGLIDQTQRLEIGVTWARSRPTPEVFRRISFSKNDFEILREAARTFRLRQPKENVILYGPIHKLKRSPTEEQGEITLKTIVDGRLQSVSARLSDVAYSVAVRAHDDKREVIMTGDMKRVKQRWWMDDPVISEVPADDDLFGQDGEE